MKEKIFNFLQNLLFILSILICSFILAQKLIFKENGVFGYRTYVIITSSMKPYLEIGDVIVIKKVPFNSIKEGDIVTYLGKESDFKGKIVTHLVKSVIKDEEGKYIFYTKGNLTNMVDPAVYEEQIYGKLVYRMYLISLISKLIRSKFGFVILIFIPLVIILVRQLYSIKKEVKNGKNETEEEKLIREYKEKNKKSKKRFFKKKEKIIKEKNRKFHFRKKHKNDKYDYNEIIYIADPSEELEKTLYSSEFRKEIEKELEKTMINNDLKNKIEEQLRKEKISKPRRGLENTIYDSNLLDEIEKENNKVPDIIVIKD